MDLGEAKESDNTVHGSPWMDDGNIIIQANTESGRTLYKVQKSLLSSQCASFRELFGGPMQAFDVGQSVLHDHMVYPSCPFSTTNQALYISKCVCFFLWIFGPRLIGPTAICLSTRRLLRVRPSPSQVPSLASSASHTSTKQTISFKSCRHL